MHWQIIFLSFILLACRKPGCGHEFCWLCFGTYNRVNKFISILFFKYSWAKKNAQVCWRTLDNQSFKIKRIIEKDKIKLFKTQLRINWWIIPITVYFKVIGKIMQLDNVMSTRNQRPQKLNQMLVRSSNVTYIILHVIKNMINLLSLKVNC